MERDVARDLVAGEVAPRELDQVGRQGCRAGSRLDRGVQALAPCVVRHAEHRDVLHARMAVEHILDLRGIDVDAAGDDHVAHPIADVHEALVVHPCDVAHREPVAALGLARRLRLLVVLVEDAVVALDEELARLAALHGLPLRVEHGQLDARRGPPARSGLA